MSIPFDLRVIKFGERCISRESYVPPYPREQGTDTPGGVTGSAPFLRQPFDVDKS